MPDTFSAMPRRSGFTLLEIMLAVVIVALMMTLAVPSISGLFQEQRLRESFESIEALARKAQRLSIQERRPHVLQWEEGRIVLYADDVKDVSPIETLEVDKEAKYEITFTAALAKKPAPEWTFWPGGTCEPAVINYEGKEGTWAARFDPLTARGTIEESKTK